MQSFSSNKPYLLRAIYEWLLDNEVTPYLIVNAQIENVVVPEEHINNGEIILNISPSAVQNLVMANDKVHFSARFSGQPRNIYLPIESIVAVFAKENGLGMSFVDMDDSTEFSSGDTVENVDEQTLVDEKEIKNKEVTGKSHLKVVK